MITLNEIIVVEGKYDKIKLSRLFDTLIIATDGFRIYKDKQKAQLIKTAALKRGVIIITDSDTAGLRIRNRVRQLVGDAKVKNVYLPQIAGKEKRKAKPGAEGILGVEGIPDEIILNAVAAQTSEAPKREKITKAELFDMGLCGGKNSSELRKELCAALNLPQNLSTSALLDTINVLYTKDEFYVMAANMIK